MTALDVPNLSAYGLPGVIVMGLYLLLRYTNFGRGEDPGRGEVLAELKALRRENADENRAIRDEIAGVKEQVTDLKARTQENIAEHGRRLERIERRP